VSVPVGWHENACENIANVTRSIYRNVVGKTKTRASRKPVPLHPILVEELRQWRSVSPYQADSDFLFPSIQKNGSQPLQPDMILKRHIRPVLEEMGVKKQIGWHSFRHGLSQLLRQRGVDVKIVQELLRHANSRITLDIYQQTVTEERRAAQTLAFSGILADNNGSLILSSDRTQEHPNGPQKEEVMAVNS
jgi:integrase